MYCEHAWTQKYEESRDDIYATMSADATCRGLRSARDGQFVMEFSPGKSSPVSIQTQSLALRALRKRKPQETQVLALASSQSWLPLLRPSIPIGWRLRLLREN